VAVHDEVTYHLVVIEHWLKILRDENAEQLSTSSVEKDTGMEEILRLHGETVPRLSLYFWSNWQLCLLTTATGS